MCFLLLSCPLSKYWLVGLFTDYLFTDRGTLAVLLLLIMNKRPTYIYKVYPKLIIIPRCDVLTIYLYLPNFDSISYLVLKWMICFYVFKEFNAKYVIFKCWYKQMVCDESCCCLPIICTYLLLSILTWLMPNWCFHGKNMIVACWQWPH